MSKRQKTPEPMTKREKILDQWDQRRERIYNMNQVKDMSYFEIALAEGITPSRVGQICMAVRLKRKRENGTGEET